MKYLQKLISLENKEEWKNALDGIDHAFAHTWESCYAMYLTTGYPTFLYLYERGDIKVICPITERNFKGYVDVVTPYGFGGFIGNTDQSAIEAWEEFSVRQGWVCAYIGLNPLFSPDVYKNFPSYSEYNDIFVLDLRCDFDNLYSNLSENRRRELRKLSEREVLFIDDREKLESFFLNHVAAFLKEKGASSAYKFSKTTLENLLALDNVQLYGAGRRGVVETVCVFSTTAHCGEYLFGVSLPEGRSISAPLLWNSAMRLRALNVPLLNLGGGITRNDSVAQFKCRFGAKRYRLGAIKMIFRPDVFYELCISSGNDPINISGYFPPYYYGIKS